MAKNKKELKLDFRTEQIIKELQKLVTSNGNVFKAINTSNNYLKSISLNLSESLETSRESNEKLDKISTDTNEAGTERKKNTGWNKITSYYSQKISKAFENSDKNQKASLILGQQAYQFQRKSSVNLDSMAGNLTGFQEAFEVSYDKVSAGLDINSYALDRLGVATKIAGGNTSQLFQALKKNTVGLNFTNKQISNLADTTLSLNQGFGVSVDELTKSLDGLSGNLLEFGILGIAPQMEEASLRLGAALGQGATGLGAQVLASFTKGSSMVQTSILGITEERERALLSSGKAGTKAAMDLVLAAGRSSKQLIDGFVKGAKDPAFALEQATKIYGRETLQAYQYYNALQQKASEKGFATAEQYLESVRKQNKINEDFTKTWENFKNTILTPLMRTISRGYNSVAEFLTESPKFYNAAIIIGKAVTTLGVLLGGLKMVRGASSLFGMGKNAGSAESITSIFSSILRKGIGGARDAASVLGSILRTVVTAILEILSGIGKLLFTGLKTIILDIGKVLGTVVRGIGMTANVWGGAALAALPAAAVLYDTYGGDPKETKVWQIRQEKHTQNLKQRMEKMVTTSEKIEFLSSQAKSEELYAKEEGRSTDKTLLYAIEKLSEEMRQSNNHLEVMKNDTIASKPQKKYN